MNADILYDILSYIKSPEDLCRFTHVCRLWYYVAINSITWEAMSVLAKHNQLHKSKRKQFRFACRYGHLKIIQWLYSACSLTVKNVRFNSNWAVQVVCHYGHLHVIQYLCETFKLTIKDIRSNDNWTLRFACENGHLNVVQYLCETFGLTVEDIRSDNYLALRWACQNGHLDVVQYLCETFGLTIGDVRSIIMNMRKRTLIRSSVSLRIANIGL